ncbi:MAG: hypothetical protein ACYTFG_04690 [Planctomycetota bacterium]|jgi:hypothetical protein
MAGEKGHLTIERLEAVYKDLASRKFTGTLSVWDETSWKEFYFADTGIRVTSIGERKTLPLGEFLVRRAFVDREALDKALERQMTTMTMLGEVLVEKEELEPDRRDKALRWQVEEELSDLFEWVRPQYSYNPGAQTQQFSVVQRKRAETNTKSLSMKVSVSDVIRASREMYKELLSINGELRTRSVYRITEKGRQTLFVKGGFKKLSDPEQRIVVLVDGKRTLEEVQKRAVVLPNDTLRIFAKLQRYGAIKEMD